MKRTPVLSLATIAVTAALAAPAAMAPAAGASAAACGVGTYDEALGYTYTITKRVNVSCGEAKAAAKGLNDAKACRTQWKSRGWTVRHADDMLLKAKYTKGKKSFLASSQGAC